MANSTGLNFTASEEAILESLNTEFILLFGSRAQGIARVNSDYDIGILLRQNPGKKFENKVYDVLYELVSNKINKLVNIDIVFLDQAPAELQAHVIKYGIPLYQRSPISFAHFKEQVMNMYADFRPLLNIFQSATLARIST